ncbi:MAG: Fosmidomycin resistance protein [Flaviaesturariibacter sp.]|nr:Fosmidomycin resistance protein [Flaviaesturariibacter sp.]
MKEAKVPQLVVQRTVYPILFTVCATHLLNDLLQSVIPAVYPLLKQKYTLSFSQIGLITFTFQLTASLLQPFIGHYTDKKPKPFSFAVGMCFTLAGILLLSQAASFYWILLAVSFVGIGSSIFHPEASRVAFFASGGKRGLAQSIFQLGGNAGSAIGPLLVALIVVPYGQSYIVWFLFAAVVGIFLLVRLGKWYKAHLIMRASGKLANTEPVQTLSKKKVVFSLGILLVLIFSKYIYLTSITSYFTFYLIDRFQLSVQEAQFHLFLFLAAVAVGTVLGGPLGDRFGRKYIIWISILGVAPFTLLLPYVNLFWTSILSMVIGLILASAFSAILVFAQELVPGKVGLISGLFFGFAFGMAGIGSAILGKLADSTSIEYVYQVCAFLPLLGIFTALLPNINSRKTSSI